MSQYKEVVEITTEKQVWLTAVKTSLQCHISESIVSAATMAIHDANKIADAFKARFGESNEV